MPVSEYRSPGDPDATVDATERRLLQSIVEVARNLFGAAAASIFLLDQSTGDLVFEAVAGEGEGSLPGTRFPAGTGIAGWVAACGQPMLVDELDTEPMFDRAVAASTGYIPSSIMAAPLLQDGECIGVLEVLDRGSYQRHDLQDVDLLAVVATQATLGLEMLVRLQWATAGGPHAADPGMALLGHIAAQLRVASQPMAMRTVRLLQVVSDFMQMPDPAN